MKNLEPLDYVSLACSQDATRYNLTIPYNDNGQLIATDGHRMHIVDNFQPKYTGYINGLDAQFPDYKQVISKTAKKVCSMLVDKDRVNMLSKLAKLIKCPTTPVRFAFSKNAFTPTTFELKITIEDPTNSLKVIYGPITVLDVVEPTKEFNLDGYSFGINLQYFLDAVSLPVKTNAMAFESFDLIITGNPLDVITLKFREHFQALIMPMRLN